MTIFIEGKQMNFKKNNTNKINNNKKNKNNGRSNRIQHYIKLMSESIESIGKSMII